jgi:protein transport protein YIF1
MHSLAAQVPSYFGSGHANGVNGNPMSMGLTTAPSTTSLGSQPNGSPDDAFLRIPKHYFAVNHKYVAKKLALLLMPFTSRAWARRRGVDQAQFERGPDGTLHAAYLPPRDDVNAPDLYIPVMAFVSYVLMVGFVFGTYDAFTAQVLARYFSNGLGLITLEVLIVKLGLFVISARPTPWLDVIAYRGYKFVGVMLAMVADFAFPRLYYFVFAYSATAMAIFLMRSHRRIILPRDTDQRPPADITQRNAFLLFVCLLQYPMYWLLILDVRSISVGKLA